MPGTLQVNDSCTSWSAPISKIVRTSWTNFSRPDAPGFTAYKNKSKCHLIWDDPSCRKGNYHTDVFIIPFRRCFRPLWLRVMTGTACGMCSKAFLQSGKAWWQKRHCCSSLNKNDTLILKTFAESASIDITAAVGPVTHLLPADCSCHRAKQARCTNFGQWQGLRSISNGFDASSRHIQHVSSTEQGSGTASEPRPAACCTQGLSLPSCISRFCAVSTIRKRICDVSRVLLLSAGDLCQHYASGFRSLSGLSTHEALGLRSPRTGICYNAVQGVQDTWFLQAIVILKPDKCSGSMPDCTSKA